ncbi:hypothetical protein N7478_003447 [Penicillium angulare]|uniref:uncharacterized protein n=1 Tax=Penicillium angulare TaxID=116970 RepID=UPI00253FA68C|nr:uncharacterized protein N7478_003447 [Penicillium angulare]KAJ5287761.1 hypothetical protein N7478_003447 [Penicillium angulare]
MPLEYHRQAFRVIRILQSGVIHVLVRKSRRRFSIHRALESPFPDSALQPSILQNINKVIFARCCKFVYSGDYLISPSTNPSGTLRSEVAEVPIIDHQHSCTNVILSHAEIHNFAYKTGWTSLCALSLYRLIQCLDNFKLFHERKGEIVELLRVCFE